MKKRLAVRCSQLLAIVISHYPSAAFIPRGIKSQITSPSLLRHMAPPPLPPNSTPGGSSETWAHADAAIAQKELKIWPLDDSNVKLLDQVHPKTWTTPPSHTDDDDCNFPTGRTFGRVNNLL